ncbi:MAG: S41 family peptidase [Bacilli bacterium]|nr:S41 family peptidase [Bacilli bacterium]
MNSDEKLRGLYTVWSEIKHYYPYQEKLEKIDWEHLVDQFVEPILNAKDVQDYYLELMKFISYVNDGHTTIIPPWRYIVPGYSKPAIEIEINDNIFRIIRVGNNEDLILNDIQVNDLITFVDDIEVCEYFNSINRLYARGSKQANEAINAYYLLSGPKEKNIKLGILRDCKEKSVTLKRDCTSNGQFFMDSKLDVNPPYIISVSQGILNVVIKMFNDENLVNDFIAALKENQIIEIHFDLRNSRGGRDDFAYRLIEQIITEPLNGVKYKYLVSSKALSNWGTPDEWKIVDRIIQPNNTTNFTEKVTVSFDGGTGSTGEDFVIALCNRPNTFFHGTLTAGSSGNPYSVHLPYGGQLRVSTFISLDPKGNEYVGKGFNPNDK